MIYRSSPDFWAAYNALPEPIQALADKAFAQLKVNSRHPAVQLKKVGRFWSARVGLYHRAIGTDLPDGVLWFWIGSHTEYDRLIK